MNRTEYLKSLLSQRIVLLDGAMGTMIQSQGLTVEDYTYEGIAAYGCNEVLNLTRGEVIFSIHRQYLDAGSDIIETNTFCANAFNLAEYGLEDQVEAVNQAACEIAREVAADFEADNAGYVFVAGVIGPTNRSLSFSPKVEDPAYRQSSFADFHAMYLQQARSLVQGGVDLLLIETVFDTLAAKSAIVACMDAMADEARTIPIMVSVTFSDQSQRTLSGQTLQAFVASLSPFPLFSLGLNCSTGPQEMLPLIRELDAICPFFVSAHPNAGFPDKEGTYTLTAEMMAAQLTAVLQQGRLNILGGCCGTTAVHIAALKQACRYATPRKKAEPALNALFSGLEAIAVKAGSPLVIGERTNVAGSRKFARLIKDQKWEEALAIAREQVAQGAQVLDICMDASMLDAKKSMRSFLRHLAGDPSVSKAAIMIDSSDWAVIEEALGEVQGRGIVNSISLKEGERKFIMHARQIARYGHAMVVMLFDEEGQAATYERKMAIAERSHALLIQAGIREQDIIFDANVLSIATGIEEHDTYARDFIRATRSLKARYPLCRTSGGVSNLSFSFRGNESIRTAMHAVLLSLADLDMAIINPGSPREVDRLDVKTRTIIEKALLAEEGDLSQNRANLIALALEMQEDEKPQSKKVDRSLQTAKERLMEAVLAGDHTYLEQDLKELETENPLDLVEGTLMDGMKEVGRLFGLGKLFLPQVVRSARTMKLAVDILQPRISEYLSHNSADSGSQKRPVAVMATVKGDVHDIGKNIVNLILRCNGFEVIDLGVMVPAHTIWEAAAAHKADLVGLSGLITPSLKEMESVITLFEQQGSDIPIFVGGATTSEIHTAVKLSVLYSESVIQTKDASAMALAAKQVVGADREAYKRDVKATYQQLRQAHQQPKAAERMQSSYAEALQKSSQKEQGTKAKRYGVFTKTDFSLNELSAAINWRMYCAAWKVPFDSQEGRNLVAEAKALLGDPEIAKLFEAGCSIVYGLFPASSDRLEVQVGDASFYFLRDEESGLCLADCIAEVDTVGLFVSTSSLTLAPHVKKLEAEGKTMQVFSLKLLADRLAEVLAEQAQLQLKALWTNQDLSFIRPAPGYPSWNDHSEKQTLFTLLDAAKNIQVRLTESFAMDPPSSVCGLLIGGDNLRYFGVKQVSEEQKRLYAKRKGLSVEALATLLSGMEY